MGCWHHGVGQLVQGEEGTGEASRAQRSDGRTSSVSTEKCLANKLAKRP